MAKYRYSVETFRDKIKDIARPYHFDVEFNGGCFSGLSDIEKVTAQCRTSSLPGTTVQEVGLNYYGILYKLAGTPTYDPLTCQFIIDSEYETLKTWNTVLEKVYKYEKGNGPKFAAPSVYMGTMILKQLNTERSAVRQYTFYYSYLSAISNISYSQDTKDTPLTFDGTITYTYYLAGNGK